MRTKHDSIQGNIKLASDKRTLTVSAEVIEKLGWTLDDELEVVISDNMLVIRRPCDRPEDLKAIFEEFEKKHGKVEREIKYEDYPVNSGSSVGNEVW